MDLLARIITNVVLAMFLFLLLAGINDSSREWQPVVVRILILPIAGIAWGYHPSSYVVGPRSLGIKRPFGSINIPIADIESVSRVPARDVVTGIRLFGSGGMFGYFGIYTTWKYGKVSMWATDRTKLILIETAKRKYVISPDKPEEMILELKLQSKML